MLELVMIIMIVVLLKGLIDGEKRKIVLDDEEKFQSLLSGELSVRDFTQSFWVKHRE